MKNPSAADRTMRTLDITHFLGRTHKANWEKPKHGTEII